MYLRYCKFVKTKSIDSKFQKCVYFQYKVVNCLKLTILAYLCYEKKIFFPLLHFCTKIRIKIQPTYSVQNANNKKTERATD